VKALQEFKAMRNRIILSFLFVLLQLFVSGCGENDTSPIMPPMLVVQVSATTCGSGVDEFVIMVEGYGTTGIAAPGNTVSFGVGTGSKRVLADSRPPGVHYDQVHFVPDTGLTITVNCP
jgi:hypothetical protein